VTLPPLPSLDKSWWEDDESYEWQKFAACKGQTELFFEHRCSTRCTRHTKGCNRLKCVREAKEICATMCPVLEHCRIWALEDDLSHGVAGAMSERERSIFRGKEDKNV
jgi:hypothetical protein